MGSEGLVPTAYLEEIAPAPVSSRPMSHHSGSSTSLASNAAKKQGPAVAPRRGAKKVKHAEALYDYTAQSDAEFSMTEGERFVLVSMGGDDGWAEVEKSGETKSVPANYIQEV